MDDGEKELHYNQSSRRSLSRAEKWAAGLALAGSVLGGIVGAIGGPYFTHWQGSEDEVRSKRAEVYPAFLNAANNYFYATSDLVAVLGKASKGKSYELPKSVNVDVSRYLNARNKFQDTINALYVYGSDAAWKAHSKVSATLPTSLGLSAKRIFAPNEADFGAAYVAFEAVECHELPAIPRSGC